MSVKLSATKYGVAAVLLAIVLVVSGTAIAGIFPSAPSSTGPGGSSGGNSNGTVGAPAVFAVVLTDPPNVPPGTTSLNITYSDVEVHIEGQSGSGWMETNSTGTVDLLQLINVSKTVAVTNIPAGSVVNLLRFMVSNSSIAVNGTIYNVTISNGRLNVPVVGGDKITNLGAALLDLAPQVFQLQTGNDSTGFVFVMVPSAKAVQVSSTSLTQDDMKVGHQKGISSSDENQLNKTGELTTSAAASAAMLTSSGNSTSFSFKLANTGNTTLAVQDVSFRAFFNETTGSSGNGNSGKGVHYVSHMDEFTFYANGTATLVQLTGQEASGFLVSPFSLAPDQSASLAFSGVIVSGGNGNPQVALPIAGTIYSASLVFTDGSSLAFNVTAS